MLGRLGVTAGYALALGTMLVASTCGLASPPTGGGKPAGSTHPDYGALSGEVTRRLLANDWTVFLEHDFRRALSGYQDRWEEFRRARLTDPGAGGSIVLAEYRKQLSRLAVNAGLTAQQRALVDALIDWPEELGL